MTEKRYYDIKEKRLVYCSRKASPNFWDEHWNVNNIEQAIKRRNWFIIKISNKYLDPGEKIIDGGCGLGDKVYSLHKSGFEAYGVDFAKKAVKLINRYAPELKVLQSDVRDLPFQNDSFGGYWSLGVIEHFFEGYDSITSEIARILRPGGYLFLSFPYMSPLRRLKSWLACYPNLPDSFNAGNNNFYQFALNVENTIEQVQRYGFNLVNKIGIGGVKGIKDEIPIFRPFLQQLFNSTNRSVKAIKVMLDILTSAYGGHSILLVLQYSGNHKKKYGQ